jgi:hypothetical protein
MNKVSPIGNAVKEDIVKVKFIEKMHTICGSKTFYKAMDQKQKDELFTKIYNVLYEGIDSRKKDVYDFFALKKIKEEITPLNYKINIEFNNFLNNDTSIKDCFNGFIKEKELLLSPITTIEKKINSQKSDIENKEQNFSTDIKNKKQIVLEKIEDNKKDFFNKQQINVQRLKKMESDKESSLKTIKKEEQQSIENIDKEIDNIDKEIIDKEIIDKEINNKKNQFAQSIVEKRINSLILLLTIDYDNILIENIQMTIGSGLNKDNKDLCDKNTALEALFRKLYDKKDDDQLDKEDVDRLSRFKEDFIDTILPSLVSCFGDGQLVLKDICKIDSIGGKKDKIILLLSEIKNRNKDSSNQYTGFVSSLGAHDLLDNIDKDGNKIIEIFQKEIEKLRENLKKLKTDREEKINLIKEKSNSINDTFDKEYPIQKEKLDKEIENLKQEISQNNTSLLQIYNDEKNILTERHNKEMLTLKDLLCISEPKTADKSCIIILNFFSSFENSLEI